MADHKVKGEYTVKNKDAYSAIMDAGMRAGGYMRYGETTIDGGSIAYMCIDDELDKVVAAMVAADVAPEAQDPA